MGLLYLLHTNCCIVLGVSNCVWWIGEEEGKSLYYRSGRLLAFVTVLRLIMHEEGGGARDAST